MARERPLPIMHRISKSEYDASSLKPAIRRKSSMTVEGIGATRNDGRLNGSSRSSPLFAKSFRTGLITQSSLLSAATEDSDTNEGMTVLSGHDATTDLARTVEAISSALIDENKDGYGNKGTHRHACVNVSFEPDGCHWDATVIPLILDTVGGGDQVLDAFHIQLLCAEVLEDDDDDDAEVPKHYMVDIKCFQADPEGGLDDKKKTLINKMFYQICLDIKRALARLEFPEFPEGCKGTSFRDVYQLNARLKSGSFATVCRGTHRATGKKVAIKCVLRKDLPPTDDAAIYDEVAILSSVKHSYICPLIDFFEERECYFLVMELMAGGDLFDRIGKKKNYSEKDARDLCKQMLEAVCYCHENRVAHCDLKPKNLLLVSEDNDSSIKLADFGFATRVYCPNSLTKQCGTPFFVAPEILMRVPYDQQSDMWSVGVIIFLLLSGELPFMGHTQRDLFRAIVLGKIDLNREEWSDVSDDAKSLVKNLLVTVPAKRMTARDALNCIWIKRDGRTLLKNSLMQTSQRLSMFNARMKLRSAMIAVEWVSNAGFFSKSTRKNLADADAPDGTDAKSSSGSGIGTSVDEAVEDMKKTCIKEKPIAE